ncbi:hypothetical protein ACEV76_01455 [Vibrio parahaemolyticus]|uniref:hypothetical protein n=1 Tax=Vibrio parahaemolyticus TaxID=670 RepID=UPI000A3C9D57|nr:hypothetical protein [Vibrio parahaemolyticus]OUJ50561.1 hypothetical protein BTO03_25610 [Vibrio parahaemolyticus]TOA30846.1 hypothetical protein CGK28_24630 [Vibrio parahaemolyticus]
MEKSQIIGGIIVGAFGGTTAGLAVYITKLIHEQIVFWIEARRIYKWLGSNTTMELGNEFRSTRAIASWNNVTEERARFICSKYKKIYLSTGQKDDMWGIYLKGLPRKGFRNDT